MALIFRGKSTCSICGDVLADGQPIVAWPHFLPQGDALWRFSDSGMHERCFEMWEHRNAMIHKYRIATGETQEESRAK